MPFSTTKPPLVLDAETQSSLEVVSRSRSASRSRVCRAASRRAQMNSSERNPPTRYGVTIFPTDYSIQPVELAPAVEEADISTKR